jgi:hypothetical protein
MTTLETGCGASSIVFAAGGSVHTAISPDAEEHARVREWCAERAIDTGRVNFIAESSDTALAGAGPPATLDLVLVDGAHHFPFPALDWFNTARRLSVGGVMVLDDANLPSVHTVVRFLRASPSWAYEGPLGYRTCVFRKLDDEVRYDSIGTRFDRRSRFDYLAPLPRVAAHLRTTLIDRRPWVQRAIQRVRG